MDFTLKAIEIMNVKSSENTIWFFASYRLYSLDEYS
jgi:hypothetical protein